jgi:hypothetical protein
MNKGEILKKIINDSDLRQKYWPEINPELINENTLLTSRNKYLKSLYSMLDDKTSGSQILRAILTNFNVEL